MKATLLLLLGLAAFAVSEISENEVLREKRYPRYIQFPDGNEELHEVDLEAEPDAALLDQIARNPADNLYQLFTKANPETPQRLVYNDRHSITSSNFNARLPTVVVVHGWRSSEDGSMNTPIRDAFLKTRDVNLIIMDWSAASSSNYVTAVNAVPVVGRGLGQFLKFLNRYTGASFASMHLVGFSLGAHLIGNAGRELDGKVARLTGLDPAGPLWLLNSNKLRASDAVYVECIHTGGDLEGLGYGASLGDVDFFPNGGRSQPGCITPICDHNRAWRLFAATVLYDHLPARHCSNTIQLELNRCRGDTLNMGNGNLKKVGSGIYRVNTRRRYPFPPR